MAENLGQKIKEGTKEAQIRAIGNLVPKIGKSSNKTLDKLALGLEKLSSDENFQQALYDARKKINEDDPSLGFFKRILTEPDPNCVRGFVENLVARGWWGKRDRRREVSEQGSQTPMTVLMSPTMRCNLGCPGCYAAGFSKKDDLPYETQKDVIKQADDMGVPLITWLGGEPTMNWDEISTLANDFNKLYFQLFTNGTLINKDMAEEMKQLGNIFPVFSIEGDEEMTNSKRMYKNGKGNVYQEVMEAMDILKDKGVPFGYSVDVTRNNAEYVSREEFVDSMVDKGAYMGWYFLHMPCGGMGDVEKMPTPEQRRMMYDRWRDMRVGDSVVDENGNVNKGTIFMKDKPIFIVDFWADAIYSEGCIAAKSYVHVNHNGGVEPCIFTQYSVDNVKEKSLYDIMASDWFKTIRSEQPYNENTFMPCMWLDNPKYAREIVQGVATPSHSVADTMATDPKVREVLNNYSERVGEQFGDEFERQRKIAKEEKYS